MFYLLTEYNRAIKDFRISIKKGGPDKDTFTAWAMADYFLGNINAAIDRLRGMVRENPDYATGTDDLALILLNTKRFSESSLYYSKAVALYEKNQELKPEQLADVYLHFAKALEGEGKPGKAQEQSQRARALTTAH